MWGVNVTAFLFCPLQDVSNVTFRSLFHVKGVTGLSAGLWWITYLFSRNVTAQSHLDLKVWSCHTLRNELLGTASVNLSNVLKNNGGKSMYDSSVLREGMAGSPGVDHSASFCPLQTTYRVWGRQGLACMVHGLCPLIVPQGWRLCFYPLSHSGDTWYIELSCQIPPTEIIAFHVWDLEQNKGAVCVCVSSMFGIELKLVPRSLRHSVGLNACWDVTAAPSKLSSVPLLPGHINPQVCSLLFVASGLTHACGLWTLPHKASIQSSTICGSQML